MVEVRVQQPQIPRLDAQLGGEVGLVDADHGGATLGVDLQPAAARADADAAEAAEAAAAGEQQSGGRG